jgi:hypothetical protein
MPFEKGRWPDSLLCNPQLINSTFQLRRGHLDIILYGIQDRTLLHHQIRHIPKQVTQIGDRLRKLGDFLVPLTNDGFPRVFPVSWLLGLCLRL